MSSAFIKQVRREIIKVGLIKNTDLMSCRTGPELYKIIMVDDQVTFFLHFFVEVVDVQRLVRWILHSLSRSPRRALYIPL